MLRISLVGLLSLAAAVPALYGQEGGKRVALIFGNDAYSISPLKNAVNDARAIDEALRASNFLTILVENAKKSDMESKIGEFLDMLGPDDTALFFYAGHGVQIANENFLVPVDFVPGNSLSSAKFSCLSVAQIFDVRTRKRAKKNIVILDACRSNPVAEKYSLEAGLAQPQNPGKETYIAFSTGPGQVAADNPDGRNSWFTEALSEYVKQPGLTLELNEVFTKVKKRVSDATEGRQTPWTISSLTSGFYFHVPLNQETENDPTVAEKWFDDARRREQREDWTEAIGLVNQILKKKRGGTLEEAARNTPPDLKARPDGAPGRAAAFRCRRLRRCRSPVRTGGEARPLRHRRRLPGREQLPAQRPRARGNRSAEGHPHSRNFRIHQQSQRHAEGTRRRVQGSRDGTRSRHCRANCRMPGN